MLTARLGKVVRRASGFTLIELLVVIGILAILLSIVLIAINPARQFAQANNTKRESDITTILNAISQYGADNKGALPAGIPVAPTPAADIANTGADLCALLSPTYVSALPADPTNATNGAPVTDCTAAYDTQYYVQQDSNKRVTVSAPNAQLNQTISITR